MPIQTYHRSPPQLLRNSTQPQHLTHHCHDLHPAASPSALTISKRRYTLESRAATRTLRLSEKFRSTHRRQPFPPTQPLAYSTHPSTDLATMKPHLTLCFVSGVDIRNSDSSSLPAAFSLTFALLVLKVQNYSCNLPNSGPSSKSTTTTDHL